MVARRASTVLHKVALTITAVDMPFVIEHLTKQIFSFLFFSILSLSILGKRFNPTLFRLLTCRTTSFPFNNPDNRIQISKSGSEHQSTIGRHLPQLPDVVAQSQAKRNNLHSGLAQVPCRTDHTVVRSSVRQDNAHLSSST